MNEDFFADEPADALPEGTTDEPNLEGASDTLEDVEALASDRLDPPEGETFEPASAVSLNDAMEPARERADVHAAELADTVRYITLDADGHPIEPSESFLPGPLDAAAEAGADPPAHPPFLGPITDLNELPQTMLAHLDQETANHLQDAIREPERFPADALDHTSIRGMHATGPASEQPKDGELWYHRGLPPVFLEVALTKYDWIVGEALQRAARHIEQVTENKAEEKIQTAMFHLRCELRSLFR